MKVVFGSWKYTLKNIWYVLPCAILPALFLALSLDFTQIRIYVQGFLSGTPNLGFLGYFHTWSILRTDGLLGGIYNICAFLSVILFGSLLIIMVEKHMRIGRRTPNGMLSQLGSALRAVTGITLLYFVIFEIWVVCLSAVLFAVASIRYTPLVYAIDAVAYLALFFVLFYVTAAFYLWLPCKIKTSARPYDAFLYSYYLVVGVRWKLVLAFALHFGVAVAIVAFTALLPSFLFRIIAFVLFIFIFLDFIVRMETVYFSADKLEREDTRRGEREY